MHTAIKILVTATFALWGMKSWTAAIVLATGAATVDKVASNRGVTVPADKAQHMNNVVGRQIGAALLLTVWLTPLTVLLWIF